MREHELKHSNFFPRYNYLPNLIAEPFTPAGAQLRQRLVYCEDEICRKLK